MRTEVSAIPRILIVDDDLDVLEVVAEVAESYGYEVDRAVSGAAGLACIESGPPDLVIIDLVMPGISGIEILERLSRTHPELPVLILSGNVDVAMEADVRRRSAAGFISKPIDVHEFGQQIRMALDARRSSGGRSLEEGSR